MEKKMKNLASTLDTIVKVGGEIFRVVGIVCGIFSLLVAILGDKMIADSGETSLELGFVKLFLADSVPIDTGFMNSYVIIGLIIVVILSFAVFIASRILHTIFEPIKMGRPFEADVPANLKKLAWVVLGCGALTEIMKIIGGVILSHAFDLETILSSDAVARFELNFNLDFGFVFVFAVIMFLSYIFSYGQKLQQESDETL
ncbi:MAG: DUF2975 domain-containing protein [Clostridia bacterium]|nr:DUF2975 domain-containing protein [Clostridia bacterium]